MSAWIADSYAMRVAACQEAEVARCETSVVERMEELARLRSAAEAHKEEIVQRERALEEASKSLERRGEEFERVCARREEEASRRSEAVETREVKSFRDRPLSP